LRGFDLTRKQLRVAPICIGDFKGGGVRIDERGRTNVQGFFAAGDVSPGSSLLYALVTGFLAGRSAVNRAHDLLVPEFDAETREWIEDRKGNLETILTRSPTKGGNPRDIKAAVKSVMWRSGGPLRDEPGLKNGMADLKELEEGFTPKVYAAGSFRRLREAMEAVNMVQVGRMILPASLYRCESRGYNQRLDFPERDDENWLKNTIISGCGDGMKIEAEPVNLLFMQPDEVERGR